jgi:hypothetical protein
MGALESDKHSTNQPCTIYNMAESAVFLKRLLLFWAASSTLVFLCCWGILIHCSSLSKRRSNDPIFLSECAATKITRQTKPRVTYVSFWPKQMLFYCVVAPKSCYSRRLRLYVRQGCAACHFIIIGIILCLVWPITNDKLTRIQAGVIGSYFWCMLGLRPIWLADASSHLAQIGSNAPCKLASSVWQKICWGKIYGNDNLNKNIHNFGC